MLVLCLVLYCNSCEKELYSLHGVSYVDIDVDDIIHIIYRNAGCCDACSPAVVVFVEDVH